MHPDLTGPDHPHRRRRVARRLATIGLSAGIAFVSLTPTPMPASAAPALTEAAIDRQSPTVVLEASQALRRYRRFASARTAETLRRYVRARNQAARATALALGVRPAAMRAAWTAADRRHQVAVLAAVQQLGVPYRRNTSRSGVGFDCSGLTSYAWRRAGVTIARSSGDQIADAASRRRSTAMAGDLVHYPGHVMLYLGVANAIVHASDPRDDVELSFLRDGGHFRWGDPTG